jgi:hypothetical protein
MQVKLLQRAWSAPGWVPTNTLHAKWWQRSDFDVLCKGLTSDRIYFPETTVIVIRNGGCRRRSAEVQMWCRPGTTWLSLYMVDAVTVPNIVMFRCKASLQGGGYNRQYKGNLYCLPNELAFLAMWQSVSLVNDTTLVTEIEDATKELKAGKNTLFQSSTFSCWSHKSFRESAWLGRPEALTQSGYSNINGWYMVNIWTVSSVFLAPFLYRSWK